MPQSQFVITEPRGAQTQGISRLFRKETPGFGSTPGRDVNTVGCARPWRHAYWAAAAQKSFTELHIFSRVAMGFSLFASTTGPKIKHGVPNDSSHNRQAFEVASTRAQNYNGERAVHLNTHLTHVLQEL